MIVPDPLDAQILDARTRTQARRVMAAILGVVRAHKQRRAVAPAQEAQLEALTPAAYLWHWLAWKLGGFKVGVDLAITVDGKVVVITPTTLVYGDPLTEEVAHLPARRVGGPGAPPDVPPTVTPHSRYKVH